MANKIIHFNARSLKKQKNLLDQYLNSNNIDVSLICETWLNNSDNLQFKGYTLNTENRPDGYGGVAILVKNNIVHKPKASRSSLPIEIIEIETYNLKTNINLVSIYIPPNINLNILKNRFKQLIEHYNNQPNTIIAGDINAHNSLWEYNSKNDQAGSILADIITESNFIILNTGEHTYQSLRNNYTSTLDIALAHNSFFHNFTGIIVLKI